jgi:hypothetical protein
MDILDRIAATSHPVWSALIDKRRREGCNPSCTEDGTLARNATEWGRKGGSHFKDGQFTKK